MLLKGAYPSSSVELYKFKNRVIKVFIFTCYVTEKLKLYISVIIGKIGDLKYAVVP